MESMYVNKKNKLDYFVRLNVMKHVLRKWCVARIARKVGISRQSVYSIKRRFEMEGVMGLQDHRPGVLGEQLNPSFYANVVELRKSRGWGACRIEVYFRKNGYSVSHNRINQVIQLEGLAREKMGKRPTPKYVSYQAEAINDQWHMDWSLDPLSKKQLLVILDDRSRFVVFAGLFESASAENSAYGLQEAINKYGAPKEMVSDNGSHFKNIHQRTVNAPLKEVEQKYGVKHIFIRAGHPQSNGKVERLFGSYKGEFPLMNYKPVKDCMTWMKYYNEERIHQSLGYETPASVYLGCQPNPG